MMPIDFTTTHSNFATAAAAMAQWQKEVDELREIWKKILRKELEKMYQQALNGKPFDKK